MKTLLQINVVVNSGSTGRIAEEIGQTAMAKGWKSVIAYGRNERPSQSQLIKIGTDWDIKMHGMHTRLFDRHGLASKSATKELIQQIMKIKPDIIHLHNIHGYYLNIEVLFNYLKRTNVPVVWTLHDCWPLTGHCTHFEFVGCKKWKSQCTKCPQTKEYPASYFVDRSEKNFQLKKDLFTSIENLTIVPVSQWLYGLLNDSFLKNQNKITIHNGIDTNIFYPCATTETRKKYDLEGKFILLGVASIWTERKGLKDFVELSSLMDESFRIVLIGLNAKQIKNLPANIIGLQHTESVKQLAELYSLADIYLNPTYEDNFPTTNIESLACGTPVITYQTGGSPEAIDINTGIIVEQGNLNEMIVAIKAIQSKGKTIYTTHCRERALKYYKKEERFQEYLNMYESLIK